MGRPSISSTNIPFHQRSDSNGVFRGPRRVFCFCILGILTPTILMSIPLLMRFVFYGVATYHLNPSDMRLLDEKISTIWCERESVKINTTFTLYVTDGDPALVKSTEPMTIRKTLIVPDDHKEYWGFYLLKGSTFSISTCAKFKGGTLLVVKGRQHLEHCAYIGNEDSNGDSDEFSNSRSREKNPSDIFSPQATEISSSTVRIIARRPKINLVVLTSSEEMSVILSRIRTFIKNRPRRFRKLRKNLMNWMLLDNNSSIETNDGSSTKTAIDKLILNSTIEISNSLNNEIHNSHSINNNTHTTTVSPDEEGHHKIRHAKSRFPSVENVEFGTIRKKRHISDSEVRKMSESGENGAFEDDREEEGVKMAKVNVTNTNMANSTNFQHKQSANSMWVKQHSLHTGILNDTNINDGSNSESESSFSSSEEALAKCEGIVGNFNLKPLEECGTIQNDSLIPLMFNATVNVSGYYYFIFGSENEKTDNFIEALFELEKYEYELGEPLENCTGIRECEIDLKFASQQKLVVSIPQPLPNREEIWDEFYFAETECKPRTSIYLIFVLTVPLMILVCAFQ